MQISDIPSKFNIGFASSAGVGYVRNIPQTPSGVAGQASLELGFPPDNFTPVSAGGIPPFGQDFNGILNQITLWNRWQAAGGAFPTYDSAFQTAISGYPKDACVASSVTTGLIWISIVDNNITNPDTGGAGWAVFVNINAAPFSDISLFSGSGTLSVPSATYTKRSFSAATIGPNNDVVLSSGSCKILNAGRYFITTTSICGSDPATYNVVGQYPSAILKNSSLLSNGSGFQLNTAIVKEMSGSNVFVATFAANDLIDAAIYQASMGAASASMSTNVSMTISRVK